MALVAERSHVVSKASFGGGEAEPLVITPFLFNMCQHKLLGVLAMIGKAPHL